MTKLKTSFCILAAASIFAVSPAAFANGFGSYGGSQSRIVVNSGHFSGQHVVGAGHDIYSSNKRLLNGSDTASYYYRSGVRHFEKGDLEKSEDAFKAVLRANGLDKQALYYLTRIGEKQGDDLKIKKYALAYHGLTKK